MSSAVAIGNSAITEPSYGFRSTRTSPLEPSCHCPSINWRLIAVTISASFGSRRERAHLRAYAPRPQTDFGLSPVPGAPLPCRAGGVYVQVLPAGERVHHRRRAHGRALDWAWEREATPAARGRRRG